MSTVSVIIPNFNRENLVGETIQNMLEQSLPPHEVIVVDDGSTDRSVEVISSFGSRVKLIRQENQGPSAARNAGLAVATGEYIQFMDSDDLASRNKLELQVAALEQNQADIAYSPWVKVFIDDGFVSFQDHVIQTRPLPESLSILEWFLGSWFIVLQACLFRRKFLTTIEPFRKDLLVGEDREFLLRLFAVKPQLVFASGCLTLYRLHNYNKLTESGTTELRRLQDQVSIYPEFWGIIKNYSLNSRVRLDFGVNSWQLWKGMQCNSSFSTFEMAQIAKMWKFYPSIVWFCLSWFRRMMIRWRWQRTGSRWIYPYQSSFPTEREFNLITDLGLEIRQ